MIIKLLCKQWSTKHIGLSVRGVTVQGTFISYKEQLKELLPKNGSVVSLRLGVNMVVCHAVLYLLLSTGVRDES